MLFVELSVLSPTSIHDILIPTLRYCRYDISRIRIVLRVEIKMRTPTLPTICQTAPSWWCRLLLLLSGMASVNHEPSHPCTGLKASGIYTYLACLSKFRFSAAIAVNMLRMTQKVSCDEKIGKKPNSLYCAISA